jgi:hypothetical protein
MPRRLLGLDASRRSRRQEVLTSKRRRWRRRWLVMADVLRCNDCRCLSVCLAALVRALGLIHARSQGLTRHSRTEVAAVGSHCAPRKHATLKHTHATPAKHRKAVPKHNKDARASSYTLHAWKLCTHKAHRGKAKLCVCGKCRCAAHTSQEANQHSTAKVQASQPVYHTERRLHATVAERDSPCLHSRPQLLLCARTDHGPSLPCRPTTRATRISHETETLAQESVYPARLALLRGRPRVR